jgi:hypothetical protein
MGKVSANSGVNDPDGQSGQADQKGRDKGKRKGRDGDEGR